LRSPCSCLAIPARHLGRETGPAIVAAQFGDHLAAGTFGPGDLLLRGEGKGEPERPLEKDLERLRDPPLVYPGDPLPGDPPRVFGEYLPGEYLPGEYLPSERDLERLPLLNLPMPLKYTHKM